MSQPTFKDLFNSISQKDWITFIAMVVGMFMAVLDIQIVSSSLPQIQAGLLATQEEASSIQTSYLIAEVIVIPLSGFLSRALSTRILFTISAVGFTIASAMCAFAWNIQSMIVFRALQGFLGGAMIPTVFATSLTLFPGNMQPLVSVIIGLVVTLAPTLGPVLGGYITEVMSWHWMFLINVIPGIAIAILVYFGSRFDNPDYQLLKKLDIRAALLMSIGLATLEYVLEEGNSKDWFSSNIIIIMSLIALSSLVNFGRRTWYSENPIVELRSFKDTNFAVGCMLSFILGIGLYGTVYLIPVFLAHVRGLNSLQIGIVLILSGLARMASAPLAGFVFGKLQSPKKVLLIGMATFGFGIYINSFFTNQSDFDALIWPQIVQGIPLMMCFMPINIIVFSTIDKSQIKGASALYNLTRNLGGAFGLAGINTLLTTRTDMHYAQLSDNVTLSRPIVSQYMDGMGAYLGQFITNVDSASLGLISGITKREAFIMAFNDCMYAISIVFAIAVLLITIINDVKVGGAPVDAGH
jgi:DHA2 family multidrug resistance protein